VQHAVTILAALHAVACEGGTPAAAAIVLKL
jgi:hypothetical protein